MLVDIDLDRGDTIVTGPGTNEPLSLISFKRDTSSEVIVRFWKAGIQTELASGAVGELGIKPDGKYDGDLLVYAGSWVKTGTGATTVYTFTPALNGSALATLLGRGDAPNTTNDKVSIPAMFEIKWVAESKKHRTQTVPCIIHNDVIDDDPGEPLYFDEKWAAPLELTAPPIWPAFATITVVGHVNSWSVSDGATTVGDSSHSTPSDEAFATRIATRINESSPMLFTAYSVANLVRIFAKAKGAAGNATPLVVSGVELTPSASTLAGGYCEEASVLLQQALVTTTQSGRVYQDVWLSTGSGEDSDWIPPGNIYPDQVTGRLDRQIFSNGAPLYQIAYP